MKGLIVTGQRRIDRMLADDYVSELESKTTEQLRQMREECEEEESGISYARRILQGRLDILRAEGLRRLDQGTAEAESLLASLPEILSTESAEIGPNTKMTRFLVPPGVDHYRREVDNVLSEDLLADVSSKDVDELTEVVAGLAAKEHELSTKRRAMLDRIDKIQNELTSRYQSGRASVADVISRQA